MTNLENNEKILQLERENKRLKRALEEVSILNDIAIAISSTKSLDHIMDMIVQKCIKHIQAEQGAVMLLDKKKEKKPFQTMIRGWDTKVSTLPYRMDTQLSGWMIKNQQPLIINDLQNDDRFSSVADKEISIHSLLCVPLLLKGHMIGLVTLFNKKGEDEFSLDDQRLLSIIAAQSTQVIENARLLEEEQALQRIQEELRLAYEIQINLLPKTPPSIKGYDIFARSIPAKEVGGDYYDFIPIEKNHLAFCLGDISGKGMPAALLMSNLQATIRGQTMVNATTAECLNCSNTILFHNTPPEKFATFFYGILDPETHNLTYSNAGHNYPFLFLKGEKPIQLKESGIVLGCMEAFPFTEEKITIKPGEVLLIYSDGITEAFNEDNEEFGESKLIEVIMKNQDLSAEKMVKRVISAVQDHTGDSPQTDDITLLIIKRES